MKVGSYELSEPFASGATATLHLARREGRVVAVKRLHPHLATGELRARLVEEARIVGHIAHPNVVQVLETVETDREVFLVMEHVEGETLERLLALAPCAPSIAVAIACDVLAGLHAAHHARDAGGVLLGLVHRDVSPKNVIIGTDGRAKLLDFGIAKVEDRVRTTRDGHVRGTLAYMAPEQLEGEALGPAVDVYAMGVVVWEALTGRWLVEGETHDAVARQILDHDFVAPSTYVPGLPRALDAAVMRALARAPEMRFASALEMALALDESLAPAPESDVAAWVESLAGARIRERYDAPVLSTIDRARTVPPEAAPSTSRAFVPAVLVIALGVLAFLLFAGDRNPAPLLPPDRFTPSATAVEATSATAAPSAVFVASSPASAPPSASALPAAIAIPRVVSPAVPAPTPTPSAAPSAPPSAPPAASTTCSPYWVDSAGRRRFNRECLQ